MSDLVQALQLKVEVPI